MRGVPDGARWHLELNRYCIPARNWQPPVGNWVGDIGSCFEFQVTDEFGELKTIKGAFCGKAGSEIYDSDEDEKKFVWNEWCERYIR